MLQVLDPVETIHAEDHSRVVFYAARLDPANSNILDRELRNALKEGPAHLILDMGRVAYAVSPAVNVILEAHERCRQNGLHLVLIHLQPPVRRILNLSGLSSVLSVRENLEEALQLIRA